MTDDTIPLPIRPGLTVDVRHLQDRAANPWTIYRVDGVRAEAGGVQVRLVNPDDDAEVIMLTFYAPEDDAAAGEQLGFEVE